MANIRNALGKLMVLSVAVVLIWFIASTTLIPSLFGLETRAVTTQSMKAAGMPAGSLIAIEKVDPEDLRIGDVVTYQQVSGKQSAVTHRIVGLSTAPDGTVRWQTKGDSNPKPDPTPIREEQIIGKLVVFDLPVQGLQPYIVQYAGWIAVMPMWQKFLIGAGAILGLWVIPDLVRKARDKQTRREAEQRPSVEPKPEPTYSI